MIRNLLLVALGGAVGSVCRYLLSGMNVASWPWGACIYQMRSNELVFLPFNPVLQPIIAFYTSKLCQMLIFLWHFVLLQPMTAIQLNHLTDGLLLSLNPGHLTVLPETPLHRLHSQDILLCLHRYRGWPGRSYENHTSSSLLLYVSLVPSSYFIGSEQYSLRPQSLQNLPIHTLSNCSMAASTISGSSVRMPASKFLFRGDFMPIPAPVRFAEPT